MKRKCGSEGIKWNTGFLTIKEISTSNGWISSFEDFMNATKIGQKIEIPHRYETIKSNKKQIQKIKLC